MTLAGTVSVALCDEALSDKSHAQCKTPAPDPAHEAGLKWIATHWGGAGGPYDCYAAERLGVLMGYSEFGGHDWYQEVAAEMTIGGNWTLMHDPMEAAFSVLFLARRK